MKSQKGFAPIVAIFLVVLGISVVAGGYVVYKDKQKENEFQAHLNSLENSQTTSEDTSAQSSTRDKTITTNTSSSINIATKLSCDNNWDCLISATNACQSASGTISYNVPNPLIPGVLSSGKTQYEIKKSDSSCAMVYSLVSASLSITVLGRSKALADGLTNAQIDAQLKTMNDSFKEFIGRPTTCIASGIAIGSYLGDQKKYFETGNGEVNLLAGLTGSGLQSTVTTSSGQKLTCSMQK